MKYIKYVGVALMIISVIFLLWFMLAPATMDDMGAVGSFLAWSYILTIGAAILAVGLPIIYMLQNPKTLKKAGINIGLMLLVLVISYTLASSEKIAITGMEPSEGVFKLTDTGLIAMYILAFAAFAAIVVGGAVNMIRNR